MSIVEVNCEKIELFEKERVQELLDKDMAMDPSRTCHGMLMPSPLDKIVRLAVQGRSGEALCPGFSNSLSKVIISC